MASVTLSSKFQLSIPKAVREELHLQAGQRFAVITKGDIISLVPIPELSEMRGIAKGADTSNIRDRTDRTKRWNLNPNS
jgi:AbrB family looped-hinge helix DNA binding protein